MDGRELSHEVLENYRFRAIELWNEGKKVKDIADFFGIHPGSVSRWLTTYRAHGKKVLKSRKAPGPNTKLTGDEKKFVAKIISKPATEYGFEDPLWTCKKIQKLVKEKTGKSMDISSVWRWLVSWGMSYQKPERRAHEFDQRKWNKWMKEEWPKILAHQRRWQAVLYFQDECVVSLIAVMGKTWAPKGKRPLVKVTGNRGRVCISSVISKGGRLLFRLEKKTVNRLTFIEFLKQIIHHHHHRKIIVIADRARPHIAKDVENFVAEHGNKIALYFFPPYSSHKNPDEQPWAYLKKNKLRAHQAKTVSELRDLTRSSMKSIQMQPSLVRSFFYRSFIT